MAEYDKWGREIPDDTPVEMPLGFKHPPTIQEMIQQAVRVEMSRQAEAEGLESFEEADDFDVGDEFEDALTPFELKEMQEEVIMPLADKGGSKDGAKGVEAVKGAEGVGRARGSSESGGESGSGPVADDSKGKSEVAGKA